MFTGGASIHWEYWDRVVFKKSLRDIITYNIYWLEFISHGFKALILLGYRHVKYAYKTHMRYIYNCVYIQAILFVQLRTRHLDLKRPE